VATEACIKKVAVALLEQGNVRTHLRLRGCDDEARLDPSVTEKKRNKGMHKMRASQMQSLRNA
jgi:hypothetical protein